MSSNLPVLWVPPVTPPDPDERPPKRRGNLGVIAAAVAIVALPLLAWTVHAQMSAPTPSTETSAPAPAADATVVPAKPADAAAAVPAPSTSGGNQTYMTQPTSAAASAPANPTVPAAATTPASPATAPEGEAARQAVGPDGRPVRVIGLDRKPGDMGENPSVAVPSPEAPAAATSESAGAPAASASPTAPVPAPTASAAVPEKAIVPPAPVSAPTAPAASAGSGDATSVATPVPKAAAAKPVETKPAKPPVKREAIRTPSRDAVIPRADDDFADRLSSIRRSEARRAVERPSTVEILPDDEEDEVVVAPPRPRWGWAPPTFGGDRGPVLRSWEAPPSREVMRRGDLRGENCHYHLWPTEDMAFHRSVQCHWHRDPDDPSIRYVR